MQLSTKLSNWGSYCTCGSKVRGMGGIHAARGTREVVTLISIQEVCQAVDILV